MRWKLLRRRLSISAPRMTVRTDLSWPIRWAVVALMFGFSAAIALWAFELGSDLAGLDRDAKKELARLRVEAKELREDRDRAQSIANTADSLLTAERATLERLSQQLRVLEAEAMAMKADLGFFERLLPATGDGLSVRGLQAEAPTAGQIRFQLLVMQSGKAPPEFRGRYAITLTGQLDGKPWSLAAPGGPKPLSVKQYARIEGLIDHPPEAVVKTVQVRVTDNSGGVRATQTATVF
jgi:hypothetical protein